MWDSFVRACILWLDGKKEIQENTKRGKFVGKCLISFRDVHGKKINFDKVGKFVIIRERIL